jgi:hypothetical protein
LIIRDMQPSSEPFEVVEAAPTACLVNSPVDSQGHTVVSVAIRRQVRIEREIEHLGRVKELHEGVAHLI